MKKECQVGRDEFVHYAGDEKVHQLVGTALVENLHRIGKKFLQFVNTVLLSIYLLQYSCFLKNIIIFEKLFTG
jgi:hypothetical protein